MDGRRDELSRDAPGAEKVGVVAWPLLLRQRVSARVEASTRYQGIVLATALFGMFTVGFTITVLANSIPRIADELGSSESIISWVTTGPLLAFAVFGPAAGKLGDLKGQRRVYLFGLSGVCVFAALTAAAPNAGFLIAARVLGAAIGAAEGPAALAIINTVFGPGQRAKAMGWWAMVAAGGPVIGLIAGGPIVEHFGWRWIFVGQVPLTAMALGLAAMVLPDVRTGRRTPFDLAGAVTLGLGTFALLLAINRGPELGWSHALVVGGFVLSAGLMVTFVAIERRVAHPLLALSYLRRRNFTFPVATQFFTNFAYMGGFIVTPLFLQHEFGYGESRTSVLLIARPLTFAITGPVAGYLTIRSGERRIASVGAAILVGSMVALAVATPERGDAMVLLGLALSGLGMGAVAPALATAVANAADEEDLGVVGATQQMVAQVGATIGMQVMQSVQAARAGASGSVGAYHEAYLVGAVAAAAAIGMVLFMRRMEREPERDESAPEGALASEIVVSLGPAPR